jgi:hypothetical protein
MWQHVWETFDWTMFGLQMFYSDGNSWIFLEFFKQKDLLWHQYDLLPYAQAHPYNGVLAGFKLMATNLVGMHFSVDDVSLIGSGLPV